MKTNHEQEHHHSHSITSLSTAFVVGTLLNLIFVIVEGIAGFMSNSVGLLSDAGHNLSDTVSLLLAWLAFRLAKKVANKRFTYGYTLSTILASLINASILLIAIGMIVVESIRKFSNPQPVDGDMIIWVAAVGVVINFATAMLFMKDRKKDLNIKGAFLHMAMDALVSVGVVISGIAIKYTGWTIIDPIIGLVIAGIIFISTWNLLKESLRLSLDAVPESIDIDEIEKEILSVKGVSGIHHIHIWALGTSENAMTIHVAVNDIAESECVKSDIRSLLKAHGIAHATIETEPKDYVCNEECCEH
ncbi:MAG: cation diffusion facilitator family transporter [Bacteroidales bacterium]|jgi:cobalt-zinc-cadmium efflux system protein|nr:cation diffusion facilitator family transporter [Bacteroidales bacterium]MDD2205022.1 cation diffusion facilitator family transporter [Bacteroidales bacterium]MDD3152246.1 cation diffusion facilitator family transporter [Bacteroidales bacterium]MDD3914500.1 cation diffusion facilitator family transporter [Bacteroidales bacterium]MDD4634401.1 cation diffusion facilitator family transporter [Bacteroidales bacterium]